LAALDFLIAAQALNIGEDHKTLYSREYRMGRVLRPERTSLSSPDERRYGGYAIVTMPTPHDTLRRPRDRGARGGRNIPAAHWSLALATPKLHGS
jgi:hypothetical protein